MFFDNRKILRLTTPNASYKKLTLFIYFNIIMAQVWIMKEINFEDIKVTIKNQCKYDYLKMNHSVEMDKVINDYAKRMTDNFVPFESIALFSDFSSIAGPEVVTDLFRFFANIDYDKQTSWVDELSERELIILNYVLENFPFSEDYDITNCSITDLLKSIIGRAKLPEKFTRERIAMKKLNNGGWGLVEMLVLSGILLIALLVAVYFIYVLYSSF